MIAERTVHPETMEDLSRDLSEVIEDFDRAVNVEALRLAKEQVLTAKEIGKHPLPQSADSSFSIVFM